MDIQRIRNLTTGRLHTKMQDIYEDIEFIVGEKGIMTHMLPNANRAMQWWLRDKLPEQRLWNGEYDTSHVGELDVQPMNEQERGVFWYEYGKLPSLIGDSKAIVLEINHG